MKIIHTAKELGNGGRKVCLAIGVFDGVHLGHQQIIRQTIADARQHDAIALVLTFDRHPNTVVAPDRVPPLIYSLPQKTRAIEALGSDAMLLLHFDRAFSEQTGEAFIRQLARDLGQIQSICVGADFVFGRKRTGNVELLKTLGAELNFTVHGVAAISLDGQVVSSTRIREAIRIGEFASASQMLGRAYSLAARVVEGDKLGQQLGFPTANLDCTGLVLPPNGVYAAHVICRTGGAPVSNQSPAQAVNGIGDRRDACPTPAHRAALNIGNRPTVSQPTPQLRVEVHLLDFSGDLYGEEMEVTFIAKLRDEKKFASLGELKAQITRDIAETKRRL
ncbi:MAG: bifunctional riboflavin kinase/FAD synthetase [Verrucomicrobia bacterium]|nr:bifunctional riboflavin kinase/FAD synthetase [Verrucomicrobiota bacterium]